MTPGSAEDFTELAREWVALGEADFLNAKHTLTLGDECPYNTVCFHAQQGAEKYLKALLAYLGLDFGRTHDLDKLLELLPREKRPALSVQEQELLSDYAVSTRYPGVESPFDRQDAVDALALAKKVRSAVRNELPAAALAG